MKTAPRPALTRDQVMFVASARGDLAASKAESNPAEYGRHCGVLEYRLEQMLAVIDELTGGDLP